VDEDRPDCDEHWEHDGEGVFQDTNGADAITRAVSVPPDIWGSDMPRSRSNVIVLL